MSDPLADVEEAKDEYGITLLPMDELMPASALVMAVTHEYYRNIPLERFKKLMGDNPLIIDVKAMLDVKNVKKHCIRLWRL